MHFEVEKKFAAADFGAVQARLAELGASPGARVAQVDCYFRHPQRDFAQTDEAFRMRQIDDATYLTYKGPKIDVETKSRAEEEVRLADGPAAAATCRAMLLHLGFEPIAEVRKLRVSYLLRRGDHQIEVSLDEVEQVGAYVEVEIVLDATGVDDPAIEEAKREVAIVADQLELTSLERRSYLKLLLDRRGGTSGPTESRTESSG